jgi:hypothetical protein
MSLHEDLVGCLLAPGVNTNKLMCVAVAAVAVFPTSARIGIAIGSGALLVVALVVINQVVWWRWGKSGSTKADWFVQSIVKVVKSLSADNRRRRKASTEAGQEPDPEPQEEVDSPKTPWSTSTPGGRPSTRSGRRQSTRDRGSGVGTAPADLHDLSSPDRCCSSPDLGVLALHFLTATLLPHGYRKCTKRTVICSEAVTMRLRHVH